MKFYLAVGTSLFCMSVMLFLILNIIGGGWARVAPTYERVRILDRTTGNSAGEILTVQLSPEIETTVMLDQNDQLHAEAPYVCVGIFGDPATPDAKATFADMSNCPLPMSRTLPLSGKVNNLTGSGKKTFRTITGRSNTGSPAGKFPKNNLGFSSSR